MRLVEVLVSQRSSKQENWGCKTHDDGKHKMWFGVGMVTEPLELLVMNLFNLIVGACLISSQYSKYALAF